MEGDADSYRDDIGYCNVPTCQYENQEPVGLRLSLMERYIRGLLMLEEL